MKLKNARHLAIQMIALLSFTFAGVLLLAPARAAGTDKIQFHIPSQSLQSALNAFALQAKKDVLFSPEIAAAKRSVALDGEYDARTALQLLLAGTGLTFRTPDERTILVDAGPTKTSGVAVADTPICVAQSTRVDAQNAPDQSTAAASDESRGSRSLDEIVVTGTLIRGSTPVGAAVTVYTRADIEQSGVATLDQFARLIPSNFSGADTVATGTTNAGFGTFGQGAQANAYAGTSFNLHGLGPNSTLTLLNGHRLAGGGSDGSITDASMIPLSAIERIEILDDGASAIYGSDAVAGVVNIITRKDFDGAETRVLYGRATGGGDSNVTAAQLFGKSWSSGNALLSYEYNDQGGLDASQRDYIAPLGGPYSLIPENRRNSVFVSGNQSLGDTTALSFTGLYSRRAFSSNYTANGAVEFESAPVSGDATQTGATLGLTQTLWGDWRADVTGNYSRIKQTSDDSTLVALPAFGFSENIKVLADNTANTAGVDALFSGSLLHLPGGAVKSAVGGSFRSEQFQDSLSEAVGSAAPTLTGGATQRHVSSAYVEVAVPVIGEAMALPGARSLNVSAAGRYDRYSDFGSTSNYKFGLAWEIVQGIGLRSTFGTSFQAPLLSSLISPVTAFAQVVADPASPSGTTDLLTVSGGNPSLQPETARIWTVGLDFKPASVPQLSFSPTFFHIVFTNRTQIPPSISSSSVLAQPLLTPFIERNPPLSVVENYFNTPGFQDENNLGPGAVTALYDGRVANIASTEESGVDLSARYVQPTAYGQFSLLAAGTRLFNERFTTVSGAPPFELVNTFGEPTSWKVRGGPGYSIGGFTSGLMINYINSYTNNLLTPTQRIASWTTADLNLGYRFTGSSYLSRNLSLGLNVLNLTDKRPPFALLPASAYFAGQSQLPYDSANASPLGRFVSLQFTKGW